VAGLAGKGGLSQFSLPLGAPAGSLPEGPDDFGSIRTFNGLRRSLHTGRDYPVGQGSAVKAVADGTVVLAADQFFSGNSVYIDHGGGFVSMTFHLSSLAVKTGDTVKRGQTLGAVGDTGRTTGPHVHLGVRWQGQRIDPTLLLDDPTALPSVGDLKGPEKAPAVKKGTKRTGKPVEEDEG
jgi:murein DD-endopeptidase MepM/ murein hydrolase activator NlpD